MPEVDTCKKEGCKSSDSGGKGYCRRHYAAWRRGELAKPRRKSCKQDGCRKPMIDRGRCAEHLARDFPGKSSPTQGSNEAPPVS